MGLSQLALAQDPIITQQPTNQTVYVGGNATMSVQATSTNGPVTYQWQRADGAVPVAFTNIPAAIGSLLSLSNVTLDDTGDYRVIVANAAGDSVTSQVAHLEVMPVPFTRITEGPVVEDRAAVVWASPTWWDYDNDCYVELFVGQLAFGIQSVSSAMYHKNGDGTFTKVTNVITAHPQRTPFGAVGDHDNDGNEDLLVVTTSGAEALFRNDGQGNFTPQTNSQAGPPVGDIDDSAAAGWADYDRDGFIDIFAANSFHASANPARSDCLYRNDGDGSFTKMTANQVGMLVGDQAPTSPFSWGDYDNDGWPDLWVGSANATSTGKHYLWHNNGDGTFSLVSAGSLDSSLAMGTGQWADYDNDGDLDLCLTYSMGGANTLHRNDGGLTFTDVSEATGVTNAIGAWAAAWGDFDNDGFLDLMVPGYTTPGGVLYRNNGDETFQSINVGSPVNGAGVAWADYDNDGFLDLFITSESAGPDFLYHNNGNGNQWLKVKLVG
ncbi:MAG: immunoglobulin domain-containing protein, partial [Verrucomicrobia bacterium]|nr:immunoglobulin domain-containing protein [Verrucomicrobiota bacterium]